MARKTGIAINHMGKYLRTLLDLRFIRRILSEDVVGRAWTRHAELDVVAVGWKQRCVLIGECKWETERVTDAVLESLITRAENFPNFAGFKKSYTLFSK